MGNKEKKFKVQMTKEALYDFLVHQAYSGLAGIFTVVCAIVFFIAGIVMYVTGKINVTYLICLILLGIALALSTPFQLNLDVKKSMKMNTIYKDIAWYTFSDRGITVTQKKNKKFFPWNQIIRVSISKKAVGFYYDKQYALVIPREVFDEQELLDIVKVNMPARAIK